MYPANLEPRQFVGLRGADRRLHNAVENVAIELRRSAFPLWFDMFGHELARQLGNGGHAPFRSLLVRRIMPARYRT